MAVDLYKTGVNWILYKIKSAFSLVLSVNLLFLKLYVLNFLLSSSFFSFFLTAGRPDMTSAVNWALKANYLSIYLLFFTTMCMVFCSTVYTLARRGNLVQYQRELDSSQDQASILFATSNKSTVCTKHVLICFCLNKNNPQ